MTEQTLERFANQLEQWELESYSSNNALNGWHRDIFYDATDEELFPTGVESQGTETVFDDENVHFVMRIYEKNIFDYYPELTEEDFKDKTVEQVAKECNENMPDYYAFIHDIIAWILNRNDYASDDSWEGQKPSIDGYF
jgi:hypothetical protein